MSWKRFYRRILLGLGFDAKNGHKRISWGKNFWIWGGSKETHRFLQEKIIKFNEQLKRRGKTLDEISKEEFYEIADKIGLDIPYREKK